MDPGALIDRLLDADVIDVVDADNIRLTGSFIEAVDAKRETLADASAEDAASLITSIVEPDVETSMFIDSIETNPDPVAEYLALAETTPLSHEERLRVVTVFDQFQADHPPDDGSPRAFTPVHGDRLPFLVAVYEKAIAYIWLDDCPECDIMVGEFDDIFPEPPDDLALWSVYGPDAVNELWNEYRIFGGPTTLFFLRGRVDARLYGAQYRQVLDTEIEKHRNL